MFTRHAPDRRIILVAVIVLFLAAVAWWWSLRAGRIQSNLGPTPAPSGTPAPPVVGASPSP